mmetsp:Transcript_14495/g.30421  ORF Transcript_14495/g.30421 Transcript_14495/m.30421 type:complete len:256 (-) Transcript_14495:29-796(-)
MPGMAATAVKPSRSSQHLKRRGSRRRLQKSLLMGGASDLVAGCLTSDFCGALPLAAVTATGVGAGVETAEARVSAARASSIFFWRRPRTAASLALAPSTSPRRLSNSPMASFLAARSSICRPARASSASMSSRRSSPKFRTRFTSCSTAAKVSWVAIDSSASSWPKSDAALRSSEISPLRSPARSKIFVTSTCFANWDFVRFSGEASPLQAASSTWSAGWPEFRTSGLAVISTSCVKIMTTRARGKEVCRNADVL